MNETNETKNSKKLGFFKKLFIFGSTPSVLLNCLGMIVASILLLWLSISLLKCYTNHGETYEVPDFSNTHIDDVKAMNTPFVFDFSENGIFNLKKRGIVLAQDPKPGARAKKGRTIYLTYSNIERREVKVPNNLYGLKYAYAISELEAAGFQHKVIKKVIDADYPGTVKEVRYKGRLIEDKKRKNKGFKAAEKDTIGLVISEDYNGGSTEIPNLVCLTYQEALFKLRSGHNLTLGMVTADASVRDSSTAYVVGQNPFYAAGQFINIGSQIDLRITQHKPADCGNEIEDTQHIPSPPPVEDEPDLDFDF